MKTLAVRAVLMVCLFTVAPGASAQSPAVLSGTWILQGDATAARSRRAINGISIATRLVIRQSEAEVSVESNTGTDGAIVTTTYALGRSAHAIPGPIGWNTVATSRLDGGRLLIDIRRSVEGPQGELVFEIGEVYSVTGDALTLERTQGKTVQTLQYTRG
jgi:hypothetical protein